MALVSQPSQDDNDCLLVARMDNSRVLASILKAISFREKATCFISSNGLKMTVEQAKCVQASAFIQSSLFRQFQYSPDYPSVFVISLSALIECLSIFGPTAPDAHTALKMSYAGKGHPLSLLLEEGGVLTDCQLTTQDAEETLDFDFVSANVVAKLIMAAECLREAFSELDMTSEVVEVMMTPDPPHFRPHFRLTTFGYAGTTQIDHPKDSEMVEVFECQKSTVNRYKLSLLRSCTKALSHASKISLRVDHRGFLSLQCMIIPENKQVCFVEFLCVPDEDMDS
ncbi:LOW QUALITY PROTEIN: cell cycle checkpoint protein RAD1-like [Halichondria panicea]|uniref:LOW QUALITY PROTEIN: cell cycle checkpoint protein RAD1-like n=1 Tax=Halichondria panicea TaxID=6063 RepID=UPI00312B827D